MANNSLFLDSAGPRAPQQQQNMNNGNGNGAGMNGMPMMAGQQMDVNFLYQMVVELSEALKENREQTAGIIAGAEELAVRVSVEIELAYIMGIYSVTETRLTRYRSSSNVQLPMEPVLHCRRLTRKYLVSTLYRQLK